MLQTHNFTYDNNPAQLLFSDTLGEVSEIWYFDKGIQTRRVIKMFCFDESLLKIEVTGTVYVYYNDDSTLVADPAKFTFNATAQETLDYFAVPSTKERVKRMEVNGTAIAYLGMVLFNSETGAFEPQIYVPELPVE